MVVRGIDAALAIGGKADRRAESPLDLDRPRDLARGGFVVRDAAGRRLADQEFAIGRDRARPAEMSSHPRRAQPGLRPSGMGSP